MMDGPFFDRPPFSPSLLTLLSLEIQRAEFLKTPLIYRWNFGIVGQDSCVWSRKPIRSPVSTVVNHFDHTTKDDSLKKSSFLAPSWRKERPPKNRFFLSVGSFHLIFSTMATTVNLRVKNLFSKIRIPQGQQKKMMISDWTFSTCQEVEKKDFKIVFFFFDQKFLGFSSQISRLSAFFPFHFFARDSPQDLKKSSGPVSICIESWWSTWKLVGRKNEWSLKTPLFTMQI